MAKITRSISVCPVCKSQEIYRDQSNPLEAAAGLPAVYRCAICRHMTYSPLLVTTKAAQSLKKAKRPEDNGEKLYFSYGRFEIRFLWKILGPATLAFAVALFVVGMMWLGMFFTAAGALMTYLSYSTRH